MVFLPPTPLIIDCYIAKVPPESLSIGLQPPEFWRNEVGHLKFFCWDNLHSLSLPRGVGRFITEMISIDKFLIIG
ncbi:hypothetical protein A6V25_03960 [Nostoc sp. ATCC 53789]|nr:hypothetical protein A6V25_03960 [Nostoc sp. ATCC 53789]